MKRLLLLIPLLAACGQESQESKPEPAAPATADRPSGAAIEAGVAWLRGRARDGVWFMRVGDDEVPSAAVTALALAPIAASLPADARRDDPLVKQACAFLLSNLQEDGAIRQGPRSKYDNYFTSATLMALEIVGDPAHAAARGQMRDFLLTLQRREKERIKGGFGYNTAGDADLSNSQFAVEALRAAGIAEDHPAMQQALRYLERVQNRSENEANQGVQWELEDKALGKVTVVPGNDGSAGYEPGVSKAGLRRLPDGTYVPRGYGSMTYALLKCYILVGLKADDDRVRAVVDWIADNYTWDENPGFKEAAREQKRPDAPYWGLYYYYMTAAKALRLLGLKQLATPQGARDWRADLSAALVKRQRADGSWVNDQSERWEEADPVITTSYALIALQEIQAASR